MGRGNRKAKSTADPIYASGQDVLRRKPQRAPLSGPEEFQSRGSGRENFSRLALGKTGESVTYLLILLLTAPGNEKESDRAFGQASLNLGSSVPESSSPGLRKL